VWYTKLATRQFFYCTLNTHYRIVYYDLSNGTIFNNLEQPLTQFSRSRYTLTLNIS